MRDKVLSQIAKKAGIKIVKESAEAIKRSAGKADGGRFKAVAGEGNTWEIPEEITKQIPNLKGRIIFDEESRKHVSRHKREILSAGYTSVDEFLNATFSNIDEIYDAGNGDYDLVSYVRGSGHSANRAIIGIVYSKNGWQVKTAHPLRASKYSEKVPLWTRTPNGQNSSSSPVANLSGKAGLSQEGIPNSKGVKPLEYQGTIYGYYDPAKKELHLNEEVIDLDTPIHEWTHIWWAWLKGEDPRMIERWLFAPTKKSGRCLRCNYGRNPHPRG